MRPGRGRNLGCCNYNITHLPLSAANRDPKDFKKQRKKRVAELAEQMRDAEEECHKIKTNIKAAKFLLWEKKKLFSFRPSLHVFSGMQSSKQGVMFYNYILCFSSGMMFIFCICCRVGQYFVPTYFLRLCESQYFVLYGLN
ncbi:kinesin-like protein KIN-14D isoform X1 [Cinnamomum micranthum f. kanehirae]|uniref:Kinesin-like protein KIN-14D isoform X1 n=1 Tax=Cinnamomum micranthum f. kanehirae TaxID=337451 RepID=A0A3S3N8W4_9MAGN|nr:kinesin-like protein KIN-14D isoform X1 [Cinnamomum micranthum f. kanehirae]